MQSILASLDREQKLADNWHLRARSVKSRPNTLYLIYDPADVRLVQTFKADLIKKGLQVIYVLSHNLEVGKIRITIM